MPPFWLTKKQLFLLEGCFTSIVLCTIGQYAWLYMTVLIAILIAVPITVPIAVLIS